MTDDTTPDCLTELIAPGTNRKITDRGMRFVDEYMIDLNASRAARAAGYKSTGFPTDPLVMAELEKRRKEASDTLKISGARVLKEYARIAFLDTRKLFDDKGKPKDFMQLDGDVRAAITSMEVETQGQDKNWKTVSKYKFANKLAALESLGRHLGLFPKESRDAESDTSVGTISDMSDNEQARRLTHMLHTAMKKTISLKPADEPETIEILD